MPKIANTKKYTLDNTEDTYAVGLTDLERDAWRLSGERPSGFRTRTIKSGDMLEVECFPYWPTKYAMGRAPKTKASRDAQFKLNNKNAIKNVIRLANTNFTKQDIWITVTYAEGRLPASAKAAVTEANKYLRKIKSYIKKHNLPELKYLMVTEWCDDEKKGKVRVHHHILMNLADRDIPEKLWHGGERVQSRRLQPDEHGFEGLGRYITKSKNGTRRYTGSRNLKKPSITHSDYKLTKSRAEKIARGSISAQDYFEKENKHHKYIDHKTFISDYVSGCYIYARMRRRD